MREEMTCALMDVILGNAITGGAAVRLGLPAGVASFHIGIPLGTARRVLDEITTQAIEKGRGFPPSPLPTQPHFRFSLGKAETQLASVRALALQLMSELYAETQAGVTPPPPRQAQARAACTYISEIAQDVTSIAFQAAGGGALFDANPLQRCFRDVVAAGQHFVVSQTSYQALGQFKLNQPDALSTHRTKDVIAEKLRTSMPNAEEIIHEVESFYRGYIDAFNREDIDQFTDAFAFPYAWITGEGGISTCANESDHQCWLGRIMGTLKERGWNRSAIDRMRAWPMAENLAMVMADYTRYKGDDTVLENGRACYTVRRDGKKWKIVALAEVKPPYRGPGDIPR